MARMHRVMSPFYSRSRARAHHARGLSQSGFTLLELAIVLTIIAMIMGGGLSLYAERLLVERMRETNARLDRVEAAIAVYVKTFGTLPCPGVGNVGIDQAAPANGQVFGRQSCNASAHGAQQVISTGFAPTTRTATGTRYVIVGSVPTRTLGLPDSYAFDGWNNRLMYAVDNEYSYGSATSPANPGWGNNGSTVNNGAIRVWGYNDTDEKTNCGGDCAGYGGGIYALWSYGQNGYGAWRDKATTASSRAVQAAIGSIAGTTKENYNAHINAGVTEAFTVNFRDALPKQTDNATTYYDDIVRWKTRLHF